MLKDITLHYEDTGYFKVQVEPKYETNMASTFEFTGKITGTGSSKLGQIPVSTGSFIVPVIAKNDEVTINIINDDYLPSCFLSLDWIGDFTSRGKETRN